MDAASLGEWLAAVALAIALAATAGLRAWLPLLLAGGLSRAGLLELGPSFQFLGSNKALVIFGIATVLELLADKVPALDHTLDLLSTPLRMGAGALLAASVLGRVSDPLTAAILGAAAGAPAALVPHVTKSAVRAASTTLTAGFANPVLSLVEDATTVVLFGVAVVLPVLALAAMGLAVIFVARRLRARSRGAVQPA
jgi:hypothetical protein